MYVCLAFDRVLWSQHSPPLLPSPHSFSPAPVDRALGLLAEDLREKYFEYLEAPDDDDDGE